MIDLAWKTSIPDRQNLDKRPDDPRSSHVLPIPLEMRHLLQPQTDSTNGRGRTWAAPYPDDYQGRERPKFLGRVIVRVDDKLVLVHLQEVLWIQSKGNLLCLHLLNADYDCRMTMKDLSAMLDPNCFFRVHRSAIVNLDYVVEFDLPRYGNAFVHLRNGKALPISRSGRATLRRNLLSRSYVEGNDEQISERRL